VGAGKALQVSANLPKWAHPKIKAWPSRLGVGYEADEPILEKMIVSRSPKREAKVKLTGL